MKIFKTPPAPESPLCYLYAAEKNANALWRSVVNRKELNSEIKKLENHISDPKLLALTKHQYLNMAPAKWPQFTEILIAIAKEGLEKSDPGGFWLAMLHTSHGLKERK